MWIYSRIFLPSLFRGFTRRVGRQLVNLDGARVFVHDDGRRSTLVAEYGSGRKLGLYTGSMVEANQNFEFVRRAIEEGYNYLDLVYIEGGLGPVSKPTQLGIKRPGPPWERGRGPEDTDGTVADFTRPEPKVDPPWWTLLSNRRPDHVYKLDDIDEKDETDDKE